MTCVTCQSRECKCAKGGFVDSSKLVTIGRDSIEHIIPLDRLQFSLDPVIRGVNDAMFKQYEKGMKEYGKPLSSCGDNDYDWKNMIIEELVDVVKYQQKEIMRLERLLNP